jgi:hypothetical protein
MGSFLENRKVQTVSYKESQSDLAASNRNVNSIDFTKVVPASDLAGDNEEDTSLLKAMLDEAEEYILAQKKWCQSIKNTYFGLGVGGIVAVFLFEIVPKTQTVDDYVWVVVGDLPPLYITTENAPNPACALDGYLGAIQRWVDFVLNGKIHEKCPPVKAEPTKEHGEMLKQRIKFINEEILSDYREDLR